MRCGLNLHLLLKKNKRNWTSASVLKPDLLTLRNAVTAHVYMGR